MITYFFLLGGYLIKILDTILLSSAFGIDHVISYNLKNKYKKEKDLINEIYLIYYIKYC